MANTTIEELLNLAYEVRDADQDRENTALRVGGLFTEIIQYLTTVVDLTTLQAIMEQYATLSGTGGLIYWRHSRIICLASMGYDLDNIDGGNWNYTDHNGDIVFRPSSAGGVLRVVGTTDDYSVFSNVVYVNNHTGHAYIWEQAGSTFKMVEIRDSSTTTIITYFNTPTFSQVEIGESYYYSSGNNRKIAIKISSDETYSFDPDPKKIYVFLDTRQAMVWDAGNRQWISVGGGNVDVINNLNSTDGTKPLSAAQGNVLKLKINEVYQALQSVYSLLGNAAFWGEKSPAATVLPDLNWNSTMFTVTINKVNSNIAVKRGGIPVTGSSFQAEEGASVTLTFEGSNTYEVISVTVNGTAVQKVNGVFTYSFVVNGNTSLEINGTGNTITAPITVTKTLNGCTVSDETVSPSEGGSYSAKITPPSGKFISNIQATMDNGNGGTTQLTVTELNDGSYANNSYMIESSNITGDITIVANINDVMISGSVYYEGTSDAVISYSTGQREIPFVAIPPGTTKILWSFGKFTHTNNQYVIAFYNSSKERQGHMYGRPGTDGFRIATSDIINGAAYVRASFELSSEGALQYSPGIYASSDDGATWTNIFDASSFVPDSSVQGE